MVGNRSGPALYEIIRKSSAGRGGSAAEQPARESPKETVEPEPTPISAPHPVQGPETSDPADIGLVVSEPWYIRDGDRIRLRLSSTALAVAAIALAALFALVGWSGYRIGHSNGRSVGYDAGRREIEAGALGDIAAARAQMPATDVFDGVGSSPIRRADTTTPTGTNTAGDAATDTGRNEPSPWIKGYTYIVVQDFRSDAWADVERAARYLHDNGIETAVIELSGDWRYRLTTMRGFNRDDPVQRESADRFLTEIRKLGQTYFDAGGRYRLEGYFKKLTSDTW